MRHISEREHLLPDQAIEKLIVIAAEKPGVLSLGPGEPDFPLPAPLAAAVRRLAPSSNHYAPPGGFLSLRKAICRKVRKENRIKGVTPENVVVTCGSQEALLLATACTLDASERIIIPNPSFLAYLPTMELLNVAPVFWPLREDFEFDPDSLKKLILPKKTGAIVLNTPANPTGTVMSKRVLEEIADIAVENDIYVFSDEAYEKFVYDGAKHVSFGSLNGMQDYAVTFQSFSKSFAMAGFRLGYVVAPKDIALAIKKTHVYSTICAPTVSQRLGEAALKLPARYVQRMLRSYEKRRRLIVPRLNEMGLRTVNPQGAFYTFSHIGHLSHDSRRFALDLLNNAKVAVVPGADFGSNGARFIRCSYATDSGIIERALDRMERFVRNYKPR